MSRQAQHVRRCGESSWSVRPRRRQTHARALDRSSLVQPRRQLRSHLLALLAAAVLFGPRPGAAQCQVFAWGDSFYGGSLPAETKAGLEADPGGVRLLVGTSGASRGGDGGRAGFRLGRLIVRRVAPGRDQGRA
jgi:hypothetical protein